METYLSELKLYVLIRSQLRLRRTNGNWIATSSSPSLSILGSQLRLRRTNGNCVGKLKIPFVFSSSQLRLRRTNGNLPASNIFAIDTQMFSASAEAN